jgi:hypothetical protein
MPTDEEFAALKKRVDNLHDIGLHYKNFYEKTFPDHVNSFARFVEKDGETVETLANQLGQVMEGVGKLAQAIEVLQLRLDLLEK